MSVPNQPKIYLRASTCASRESPPSDTSLVGSINRYCEIQSPRQKVQPTAVHPKGKPVVYVTKMSADHIQCKNANLVRGELVLGKRRVVTWLQDSWNFVLTSANVQSNLPAI